jgi:hypothetical protein
MVKAFLCPPAIVLESRDVIQNSGQDDERKGKGKKDDLFLGI